MGWMLLASIAAIISCCSWREPTVMPLIVTFLDMAKAVGTSPATPVNTPIKDRRCGRRGSIGTVFPVRRPRRPCQPPAPYRLRSSVKKLSSPTTMVGTPTTTQMADVAGYTPATTQTTPAPIIPREIR